MNVANTCILCHLHPPPQIPHLAEGVRIHGDKVTEALRPFHDRLEACFKQLREKVEKQYGAKSLVRASFFLSALFKVLLKSGPFLTKEGAYLSLGVFLL